MANDFLAGPSRVYHLGTEVCTARKCLIGGGLPVTAAQRRPILEGEDGRSGKNALEFIENMGLKFLGVGMLPPLEGD